MLATERGDTCGPKLGGVPPQMEPLSHSLKQRRMKNKTITMSRVFIGETHTSELCLVGFSQATAWWWISAMCLVSSVWIWLCQFSMHNNCLCSVSLSFLQLPYTTHRTRHATTLTAWIVHLLLPFVKDALYIQYQDMRNMRPRPTMPLHRQRKSSY